MRIVVVAVAMLLSASATQAQEEKLKEMRGTLRHVDLKTGGVLFQPLSSDKQMPMSLASKDTPVTGPLGDKLAATDLRAHLRIAAKIRGEDEIVAIRIDGPFQHGLVRSVDADKRTILYKDVYAEKSIVLPMQVKLVAQGQEVPLTALKPGDPIQLLYSLDRKSLLQVQTGKGVYSRDPALRIGRYYGILADVDHGKRRVEVFVQSVDAGVVRSYEVAEDAYLRTMYRYQPFREVGFDQFAKWLRIHYVVDRDTGKVVNIDADLPVMIRRKVLKIDGDRMTVEDELKEKTLSLAADVKVLTPRGVGKRADIVADRIVNCALSMDRSRVQLVYVWDR